MSPVLGLLQFTHSRKAAFAIWCFDLTTEFQPERPECRTYVQCDKTRSILIEKCKKTLICVDVHLPKYFIYLFYFLAIDDRPEPGMPPASTSSYTTTT